MKLDPRIIEGKRPLTAFDTEEAKQFIDKEGYFANSIDEFCNLKDAVDGKLFDVDDSTNIPFDCTDELSDNYYYSFFLPKEWVKEPKKKYRPFSLNEWIEQHEIGDIVHYRCKSDGIELRHKYAGTWHKINNVTIALGDASHSLEYLFEEYEIEIKYKVLNRFFAFDESLFYKC